MRRFPLPESTIVPSPVRQLTWARLKPQFSAWSWPCQLSFRPWFRPFRFWYFCEIEKGTFFQNWTDVLKYLYQIVNLCNKKKRALETSVILTRLYFRFIYPERPTLYFSLCYLVISVCYLVGLISPGQYSCEANSRLLNGFGTSSCAVLFSLAYFFSCKKPNRV